MLKVTAFASHPELGDVSIKFDSFSNDYLGVILSAHEKLEAKTGRKFDINKISANVL